MLKKRYTNEQLSLVEEWFRKFAELSLLINDVTGSDEPPYTPSPPTEIEEVDYQEFRFWFYENEEAFLPIWMNFLSELDSVGHNMSDKLGSMNEFEESAVMDDEMIRELSEFDIQKQYVFVYFYCCDDLYMFVQRWGLQSGVVIWEPNEEKACEIRSLMVFLSEVLRLHLMPWVYERTFDSE